MAEARRAAGVAVALYIVDIDGSQLIRLAGSEDFPETLEAPPALGPEIVPEGLPSFYELLKRRLPRCVAVPLWLRGRVIGLLLCVGAPVAPLEDIAKQGAAALELANDYTDVIEAARRRKPTTAAAEVQYHLLPPRVARVTGAQIAGALLPAYEVGGDWFDFVENRDGRGWRSPTRPARARPRPAWAPPPSARCAPPGAAARTSCRPPRASTRSSAPWATRASWSPPCWRAGTRRRRCSRGSTAATRPPTWSMARAASPSSKARSTRALGAGDGPPSFEVGAVSLEPGDRSCSTPTGSRSASSRAAGASASTGCSGRSRPPSAPTAAATAMAIQDAVMSAATDPLQDDATLVVLAVD